MDYNYLGLFRPVTLCRVFLCSKQEVRNIEPQNPAIKNTPRIACVESVSEREADLNLFTN